MSMLVMIDKRNPNRKHEHQSIDHLIDKAHEEERGRKLFYYRKRIGYNEYLIQLWDAHPFNEKARAKMVWEIYGAKRTDMKTMRKPLPRPEPGRPIIKDGRPERGNGPQLNILRGSR